MNEMLGRSGWAPTVFGTAAPDIGNAEILPMYGTDEQKKKYLEPLMAGEIVSSFSMTEPHAGADPGEFTCRAYRDGDEWVIEGEKWFSSNAKLAAFLLVVVVTDPEAVLTERMSMFIIPADTPEIEILRNVAIVGDRDPENGHHGHVRYNKVRMPMDHLLGEVGGGVKEAQARLGGGRIHHAMRSVSKCTRALDMPLSSWYAEQMALAFADGPTDVHKSQLARAYLKIAAPAPGTFPTEHIPTRLAAARKRYPDAV